MILKQPRIGLLGGSFDPIHLGHIQLATHALNELNLTQVVLIPAAQPWQRAALKVSPTHRLHMAQLAVQAYPQLTVNELEVHKGGASYTVDTLEQLNLPNAVWLLGADQLQNFCSWHRWQDILKLVDIAVAARDKNSLSAPTALSLALEQLGKKLHYLSMPNMDIAATEIRQRLAQAQSVDHFLDPLVLEYIQTHQLYR